MKPITLKGKKLPPKMKAVVLERPGVLKLREIPLWPLVEYGDPDMVLVRVHSCGICGSDLRYFQGENPWAQHTLGKHLPNPPHIVLGHEFAGEVVQVLNEKNSYLLGKRVAPLCSKTCGRCIYCRTQRENLCPHTIHTGHGQGWGKQKFYPGAYAEYVPVWGEGCYEIPEKVSYDEAALMDILAVSLRVATQGRIRQGLPVLVIGCGPAGNGIAQIAKILGASKVIVTGRSELTLKIARKQKLGVVIDIKGKSVSELRKIILQETGGYGPISVFDSVGTPETLSLGLSVLDKGGTLVNMVVHKEPVKLSPFSIGSEKSIATSCNFRAQDYPVTLEWLKEGKLKVKEWITNISLSQVPETFEKLLPREKGREFFKVVINP